MFQNTDFWIGLGIGVVAGVFGYKVIPLAELQRQKEELEDMIAAQEAAQAK